MNATLIISVYKNCEDLKQILHALLMQTRKDFEIIISEDGESQEIKKCIAPFEDRLTMTHLMQDDKGFRKNRALNRAIKASKTDYLIFIDGDCVPHDRFVEQHLLLAQSGHILVGRRAMLGERFSRKLRALQDIKKFSRRYLGYMLRFLNDGGSFLEEGIYSYFGKYKKPRGILGCNFSCEKSAMFAINGFDEDYENPALGEDSDIDWRLQKEGYKLKSARNRAIVYHLHHKILEHHKNQALFDHKVKEGLTRCLHGLEYLDATKVEA